ncbi:MAG: heme NO-binding domain-containing protein [Steroidobacteraceae bacterium]
MKGIIFNLLEEVVTTHLDEKTWDEILEIACADGAYTSLGNYPDEEFVRLLGALSQQSGKSDRETLKWFGQLAMPFLAQRYPEFFTAHKGMRSFLLSLNDIIHAEVRNLYPGADVPVFEFETPVGTAAHDTLIIYYRSKRRLCPLAEGFIAGASDHFGEQVTVTQTSCMLDGANACALVCRFQKRA